MKHLLNARNIFETAFPFYLLLKIFGFLPFTVNLKNGKFYSGWWDYLYCSLVLCVHLYMVMVVYFKSFVMFEFSDILRNGAQVEEFLSIFTVIITIFIQCYKQKKIRDFVKLIHHYDFKVSSMNESVNHRKHLFFTIKYMLYNFIPIILTCIAYLSYFLCTNSRASDTLILAIFSIYIFIQVLIMTQLAFACLAVKERLVILNKHLEVDCSTWESFSISYAGNLTLEKHLNQIILLHEMISSAFPLINSAFTAQIILPAAYTLFSNVLGLYSIFHELILEDQSFRYFSLPNIVWISVVTFIISCMIHAVVITTSEGQKTLPMVDSILNRCQNYTLRKKLKLFANQLARKNFTIGNGFFNIDWSLLLSMIVTISAYIVITFQFDKMGKD